MSSWFTSWLPGLPSINLALPSSIQTRFISFLLKKSLGHFFKPGQLDISQIDSQIGSGYVQVSDLALDVSAINRLLEDLPVELTEGSVATVTARIPWPNPLTSTIGFSIDSLHLTLCLLPPTRPPATVAPNLSDSVFSVAESFIHDELTPREEANLRESIHAELTTSFEEEEQSLPGGLNPFITTPEDELLDSDADPTGVSVFATLVERLLARFQFDVTDLKIAILHPAHSVLTLNVAEIRYRTEGRVSDDGVSDGASEGDIRSISISGIKAALRSLRPPEISYSAVSSSTASVHTASPSAPRLDSPRPVSPAYSSSSSSDEDAQFAMSQSLAFLPPRSPSPTGSSTSSMYESAISSKSPPHTPTLPEAVAHAEHDEVFLHFGSAPITLQLVPPLTHHEQPVHLDRELPQLDVAIGVISFAMRAWHIATISEMTNTILSHRLRTATPSSTLPPTTSAPGPLVFDLGIKIKGVVGLLLPPPVPHEASMSMLDVFHSKPLIPPLLPRGYLRLHLELLAVAVPSFFSTSDNPNGTNSNATLSIKELSLFAFHRDIGSDKLSASPIVITDHHLPSQYSVAHLHRPSESNPVFDLPTFPVVNWTQRSNQGDTSKLTTWRTKVAKPKTAGQDTGHEPVGKISPALAVSFMQSPSKGTSSVTLAPIHIFVDMEQALSGPTMSFINDMAPGPPSTPESDSGQEDENDDDVMGDDTPPATPRQWDPAARQEIESKRQEKLILADLDLGMDYRNTADPLQRPAVARNLNQHHSRKAKDNLDVAVSLPMIRLQIRSPSPASCSPRSGTLVLDIHNVTLTSGAPPSPSSARFASDGYAHSRQPINDQPLVTVECGRILIAHAPVNTATATTMVLVGPLSADVESNQHPPLRPRIMLVKSLRTNGNETMALDVNIPSVYVNLTKDLLDGLQYWADDITQFAEQALKVPSDSDDTHSRDESLLGSRYFAQSRTASASGSRMSGTSAQSTETVVKVTITEAMVRLMLPRQASPSVVQPFELVALDTDVLVEMKPDGKDETVITVGVMDLTVKNTDVSGGQNTMLLLTSPRSLSSVPKTLLKLRFTSLIVPETAVKESRIKVSLWGFTFNARNDISWTADLSVFFKAPPGAFESVIPSERTVISLSINDGSVRAISSSHPGGIVAHIGDMTFATSIEGNSPDAAFELSVPALALLAHDNMGEMAQPGRVAQDGVSFWRTSGFALLAELSDLELVFLKNVSLNHGIKVMVNGIGLKLHLCADTMTSVTAFISDFGSAFAPPPPEVPRSPRRPAMVSKPKDVHIMSSIDDLTFNRAPDVGPAPDMIFDDLPTNLDYLDESFGTAAGLREMRDDDLDDFDDDEEQSASSGAQHGVVLKVGGETIKVLRPEGIQIVEDYFDNLAPEADTSSERGDTALRVVIHKADVNVVLYDGYDWAKTRRTIEDEMKEMRKRLAKIRQLVANGQTQDPSVDDTSALLFNSVYIGLEQDIDDLEPGALIAAIDEELRDDFDTTSQSSWQSLRPTTSGKPPTKTARIHGKRLTRAKMPSMEFHLSGVEAEIDQYLPNEELVSRTFATVRNLEIIDRIKTSTWDKFLTDLRSDSKGNVRETGSNMVRIEVKTLRPVRDHPSEEARLKAKILPLRLHVDQDALDFLKKFFSFKDSDASPSQPAADSSGEIYFQHAEVFPVDLKLDYKPRRVDYRALREGRTIELMNFFHFDGAEMTLRHITLAGVTGWARLGDLLNDLWTPDVKATQLMEVISGVAPIRSVVNVGSGIADLVLLPIAQYKKDGRVVRGVQKGTTAFVKSTATEALRLGARLATGTQVILEQAEGLLGGQPGWTGTVTAETLGVPLAGEEYASINMITGDSDEDEDGNLISKYAEQPLDMKEGMQTAYRSLRKNFNSAAQTILAVPMEVYERSGNEGAVRSVIRAVPIAVLKPMIGASEAVSKTLLGLHNTIDPSVRRENEDKYKHRQ